MSKLSLAELISTPLVFDLVTRELTLKTAGANPIQVNLATLASAGMVEKPVTVWAKSGDRVPLEIWTARNGELVSVEPRTIRVGIKADGESRLILINDDEDGETFVTRDRDGLKRHLVDVTFGAAALASILADNEGRFGTSAQVHLEVEIAFPGAAAIDEISDQIDLLLTGNFTDSHTFPVELPDLAGAGQFRLTAELIVDAFGPGWPSQSITAVIEGEIEQGTPFTFDFDEDVIEGEGSVPSPFQWRSEIEGAITGINDGIEVEIDVATTDVGFREIRFTMPRRYQNSNITNPATIFYGLGGAVAPHAMIRLRLASDSIASWQFVSGRAEITPDEVASLASLGTKIRTALGLAYTPLCRAYSATEVGIFFQLGDPGIDAIRIEEIAGGGSSVPPLDPIDYPLVIFSNGFNAAAILRLTVEQLTSGDLPSGPVAADYVRTSQTVIAQIEGQLIP